MQAKVGEFFDRFGPMFNENPAQFAALCVVVLIVGFIIAHLFYRHQMQVANERVQIATDRANWFVERFEQLSKTPAVDREVELRRIEAQILHDTRLREKQKRTL